jgi:hypothetical protein
MATVLLEELIEKSAGLTDAEKHKLVNHLLSASLEKPDASQVRPKSVSPNIVWLKQHRNEIKGKYVALENGKLQGQGENLREAEREAFENGAQKPLLTYISNDDKEVFGGW